MAISGTIANAFIQIGLAGINTVNAQLSSIQSGIKKYGDGFKQMAEGINSIAVKSTIAFSTLSASLLKAVASADPIRFSLFRAQMELIGLRLGAIFLPTLDKVIGLLQKFEIWIINLTEAQKRAIRENTELALKILGVVSAAGLVFGALGFVVKIVGSVVSVFQGLLVALESASALWGVFATAAGVASAPILAVVAAIVAIVAALTFYVSAIYSALAESKTLTSLLKSVGLAFTVVKELIFAALSPVIAFFTAFWNVIQTTWAGILGIIKPVWDKINDIIGRAIEKWQGIYAKGARYLDVFREVLVATWAKIQSAIAPFIDGLVLALEKLWDAFENLIDAVSGGGGGIFDLLVQSFVQLAQWAGEIAGWFAKAFGAGVVNMITNVVNVVALLVNTISNMFENLRNQWNQMITYMSKYDPTGFFAKLPFWQRAQQQEKKDKNQSDKVANEATALPYGVKPNVQQFGIEEAFRTAQRGAFVDPSLLVQKAQLELQQKIYEANLRVANNTEKRPMAEHV